MLPCFDQGSELSGLNSADFHLIGGNGEDRGLSNPSQLGKIFGLAIQNSPAYAGRDCRLSHLDHFGADRLHDDGIGTLRRVLDNFHQELGLVDGIIIGVNDLYFRAEPGSDLGS